MARGKRPVPFRTRKLSLSAPMVLPWRRGGRVGRRRTIIPDRGSSIRAGAPVGVPGHPGNDRTLRAGSPTRGRPAAAHGSGLEFTTVRRTVRRPGAVAPRSSAAADLLRRRAGIVGQPGVQVPQIAPGGADLVQSAALVEPTAWLPGPCRVQRLVAQEFE